MAINPIHPDQMACTEEQAKSRIAENWATVCQQVASAAQASGRDSDSVRVVGVSKYVDSTITQWLVDAGCFDLGENRPQALNEKAQIVQGPVRWHQIGHLQRNKVRRLLAADPIIHSVDSQRLFDEIDSEAHRLGCGVDVLIEVNISGEDAKTGLAIEKVRPLIDRWINTTTSGNQEDEPGGVRILGLMGMAGWGTDPDAARRQFAGLRRLKVDLERGTGREFPEISMGMSGDYQAAIVEGATMVRIGSSLFEGVLK